MKIQRQRFGVILLSQMDKRRHILQSLVGVSTCSQRHQLMRTTHVSVPTAYATMQFNKYSWPWLSPKSVVRPADGGDSHQRLSDNTWRPFSIAAVCVLQMKQTWLNLSKLLTTRYSSASFQMTIMFCLAFCHHSLTVIMNCDRDIMTDNIFRKKHWFVR